MGKMYKYEGVAYGDKPPSTNRNIFLKLISTLTHYVFNNQSTVFDKATD